MSTYIDDLDDGYPDGSVHKVFVLDDDMRDIKGSLKRTFPNVTGPVAASHTELNYLIGTTSNIQNQINTHTASLATLSAKGVPYSGRVSAAGSGLTLPAGFSASRLSTGRYHITHGAGGQARYPTVCLDATSASNYYEYQPIIANVATGQFDVNVISASGTYGDVGFYFILHGT